MALRVSRATGPSVSRVRPRGRSSAARVANPVAILAAGFTSAMAIRAATVAASTATVTGTRGARGAGDANRGSSAVTGSACVRDRRRLLAVTTINTTQEVSAMPESARARRTSRWGVQRRSTVKLDAVGVIRQPLA